MNNFKVFHDSQFAMFHVTVLYVRNSRVFPMGPKEWMTEEAEKFNGWMAMIGFVAAMGAYVTTGQIIPGIL